MAENIIGNMFGVDPDQLRMQRYQQLQQQNMQMAQLDPFQRASAGIFNAGAGTAMLGAQALGIKTPEERLTEVRRLAMSNIDASDPNSLFQAAQKLQQSDPAGASELVRMARQVQVEKSKLAYEAAQTEKALMMPVLQTKTIETGVEGKPDYRQKMEQTADGSWKPVGTPYKSSAASTSSGDMKPADELRWMNQHGKDYERASSVIDTAGDTIKTVGSIKNNPKFGYLFGGYTEKTLGKFAPGEIAGMQGEIEILKSNLKSAGLNLVKAANQAGIGSITEKEWTIFSGMISNLDQKMDEKTARKRLGEIEKFFERTKERSVDFYDKKWRSKKDFYDPSIKDKVVKSKQDDIPAPVNVPQVAVKKYNPATGKIE